jgi:hypothetical protein
MTPRLLSVACLSLRLCDLAFSRNALMRFVGALDSIFVLAIAWKMFDDFIDTTRHIPTESRLENNNVSNF